MEQLLSMSLEELTAWLKERGYPAFRGRQLYEWLQRGASFDEMTNLPKDFRARLAEGASANPVRIRDAFVSKLDGTEKYLYELDDGNLIEGVLMRYHHGNTLCLSTQIGCRMGCAFCASTLEGCVRSLTPAEMLGQIIAVNRRLNGDGRVGNVVLMGSGEPLDNYDNVMKFLRLMNDARGLNMSLRGVSLSTCGLVPNMYRLADEGLPVTLSVSLHAPNDEIRRKLMPVARAYAMEDVLAACRNYVDKTGRRVIFEYAMVGDMNCEMAHADELAHRLRGLQCHVNLIPLNEVKERDALKAPTPAQVERFMKRLEERHISVTRRREMGDDIQGACGQLRRHTLMNEQKEYSDNP
ncbi:MAG: 23S rRNA (adenine(2503)-C(2))-methyltransferase RlmN [Clostridiales bacterium]|nr:23S rRNA (adenine(2503)-C(2))-methyltransferase RlmN [Clostridiales bacterium]MDD6872015.1 23S rRNA (adenine(2503)-C(2))-methyltransferase RlmN [Clostridiales bacterium]MDD7366289.1 23S rRNA (adenine(2503)-C(2))-methyltransferase RlmN [Clostridiales bacterium]